MKNIKGWELFVAGKKQRLQLDYFISVQIVKALGKNYPNSFLTLSPTQQTEHVMDALSRLGKKMGLKSMSHGISKGLENKYNGWFKRSEWLYDLHWYEEQKQEKYKQTSLPLVVECEWDWIRENERKKELKKRKPKTDKFGEIKWDFQKLLVANADLRVMIFKPRFTEGKFLNEKLDQYFTETITGYRNLPSGSKFLFIAFSKKGLWYSEKVKT